MYLIGLDKTKTATRITKLVVLVFLVWVYFNRLQQYLSTSSTTEKNSTYIATYIVIPCGPAGVKLHVELPFLSG